jgi:hypothetical protein
LALPKKRIFKDAFSGKDARNWKFVPQPFHPQKKGKNNLHPELWARME